MKTLLILLALCCAALGQTQYYVSTSGSDSNNGTGSGTAWRTLAHADASLTVGASGTVVNVAPGIYVTTTLFHGGVSGSRRVVYKCSVDSRQKWTGAGIQSCQAPAIVVDGPNDRGGTTAEGAAWGDFITIQNFEYTSPSITVAIAIRGNHTNVLGNYIHDIANTVGCPQAGAITHIPNAGPASRVAGTIDGNVVVHVGPSMSTACNTYHGIYTGMANVLVTNNIVIGARDRGIQIGDSGACNAEVANNTLIGNGKDGIITAITNAGQLNSSDPGNPLCGGSGTSNGGANDYNSFTNNLCVQNGQDTSGNPGGSCVRFFANGTTGTHNKAFNNESVTNIGNVSNGIDVGSYSITQGGNFVSSQAPSQLFVKYVLSGIGANLHLNSISSAIDAGASGTAPCASSPGQSPCLPSLDFDGVVRPQGQTFEVGAFEFLTGTPVQKPSPPTGLTAIVH